MDVIGRITKELDAELAELNQRRETIERVIAILHGRQRHKVVLTFPPKRNASKPRTAWTPAKRAAVARRMKQYWAKRKAAKKAA